MKIALRLAALLGVVLVMTWIGAELRQSLGMMVRPSDGAAMHGSILVVTALYSALLAVPFVPGAEIGLSLLMMFGREIALLVYGATVTGLMLSYSVGRLVPTPVVVRMLEGVRLHRAAEAVAEVADLPPEERLNRMMQGRSPRALRLAARFRYLALILAINLPGNVIIGGGGGIALVAGLSRIFAPLPFFLSVAVAVAPVPLMVGFFGG